MPRSRSPHDKPSVLLLLFGLTGAVLLVLAPVLAAPPSAPTSGATMPIYDGEGRLELPADYRRWVFVGSSLGLSYSEGDGGIEMFHETLIEPTAYDHFTRTGEFRDGTMLVLLLHGSGENVLPQRRGRFAAEIRGVEMAVKDSRRSERGWEYYGFGGTEGIRDHATAITSGACYECHASEAAHDNVFVQFYPMLADAAPAGTVFRTTAGETVELDARPASETPGTPLALRGLDPVLLVGGRSELGKPEIVAVHGGYMYQFVSEPTRGRFAADPERYSFQNERCLVVPGAELDPDLFAVHEGRLYGFATPGCVEEFRAEPERYLAHPETPI